MDLDALFSCTSNVYLLTGIFCLVSAFYLWYSCYSKPYRYFKQLGVPGPPPLPVVGNLVTLGRFKAPDPVHLLVVVPLVDGTYGVTIKWSQGLLQGNCLNFIDYISKTYGPRAGLYFGKRPFLVVSDPDLMKLIQIKNFDKFQNRIEGGFAFNIDGKRYKTLDISEGISWRRRRHMLTPTFSANKLRLMEPLFNESKKRLMVKIAGLAEKGEAANALELYSKLTLEVMLSIAFGIALDIQNGKGGEIYQAVSDMFNLREDLDLMWVLFITVAYPKLNYLLEFGLRFSQFGKSGHYLIKVAQEMIRKRREAQRDAAFVKRVDTLQLMIDTLDSGSIEGLTEGDIVIDCFSFLAAGYETTSVTLIFATYLLAVHPEAQERVSNEIHDYYEENPDNSMYDAAQDMAYLDMVMQETLRMYPVVPVSSRVCTEDCVVDGLSMKKGTYLLFPAQTLHNNPELWSEPDKFDPERFTPEEKAKRHPCAHMPFGHGPRTCIGMRFALLEVKMALISILQKYRIVLAPETELPMKVNFGSTLYPKTPIKILFEAR